MTARAAHLVDGVLPRVPVRQWVLTVPHRLRYLLAWNHPLCRAVLGVYARALLGFQRRQARRRGIRDGHAGSVTVLQRFGGGLNLTVHFHTLVLDGVFTETETGVLHFHPAPPPSDEDVARLLATIRTRVRRLLERRGLEPQDEGVTPPEPLAEESLALAGISSASVKGASPSGGGPGPVSCASGTSRMPRGSARLGSARRTSKASISTPTCACRRKSAPDSHSSAATCCGLPSPRIASSSPATDASCWN